MCGEKHGTHQKRIKTSRITPACAGKSVHIQFAGFTDEDHPRMCGEKRSWLSLMLW